MKHSDEFDQFIADIHAAPAPSPQFKDALHQKMKSHYYGSVWLVRLREYVSQRVVMTGAGSIAVMLILVSVFATKPGSPESPPTFLAQRDDWVFKYTGEEDAPGSGFGLPFMVNKSSSLGNSAAESTIGFSTGGAKDINNFRENIKNGYLPLPTDITYEGLFYDYFFDTGKQSECRELFCPSYSYAVSPDPFSKQPEYYMTVGLNSGIKESDFKRKKLNLIVVLDISGSMSSAFDEYHYDRQGTGGFKENEEDTGKKKMQVANEAIVAMLAHLNPEDRFGMVLFDGAAYEAKPLSYVGETDMEAIKKHILEIQEQGSTNHEAGYKKGREVFRDARLRESSEYENRIIFLTDAMPNTGSTDRNSLIGLVQQAEQDKIYTTFIGVGIDFNSELIEHISKVRGANYYSVHSSSQFKTRMDEEFEFMVTPLVFDLSLDFQSDGWEIEKVYGSPDTDQGAGNLMYVRTLFPSATEGRETKGGIVLLKLRKKGNGDQPVRLTASYTDRSGKHYDTRQTVAFPSVQTEYYPNTGIRKAILLTRYANLMKNFIMSKRAPTMYPQHYDTWEREGIMIPDERSFSEWERTSQSLLLSSEDREMMRQFNAYFQDQKNLLGDSDLYKEQEILDMLVR